MTTLVDLKFTGINFVQLNINPVDFHLIGLYSFCNIYMSNDGKFFETPCIYIVCRNTYSVHEDNCSLNSTGT